MTPTEQLRQAAETLRTMAEAATPGPWIRGSAVPESSGVVGGYWFGNVGDVENIGGPVGEAGFHDAAFIAAMDPNVALMLADWLGAEATLADWEYEVQSEALALAEHINERTSR